MDLGNAIVVNSCLILMAVNLIRIAMVLTDIRDEMKERNRK